jgi:hypothetical protein
MPCIKCPNGKWKYGNKGECVFDTLTKCKDAEMAINIAKLNRLKEKMAKNNKNYGRDTE